MQTSTRQLIIHRLMLALSLAASGVLAIALPGAADASKPATVPFELLASNHMVVRAKINGKGPYRLVFDLGAPITLLGNKAAEGSGVVKPDAPKSFLFAMRGEGKVDTLEVGDLKAKDLPVVVFDHPILKALSGFLGRPLDGIIGFTFFARYKTTIDYQAKVMTFEPVDHVVRDLMKDLPERLANPRDAKEFVLAPLGLWGLSVAPPEGEHAPGVKITAVAPESPAAIAGLKVGDTLTSLDGRWTTTIPDAFAAASDVAAGQTTEAIVLRDGKEVTLKVTPTAGL
jgi:membrane-associated protease RseP (regulator of RpoE activity)